MARNGNNDAEFTIRLTHDSLDRFWPLIMKTVPKDSNPCPRLSSTTATDAKPETH